MKYAFAALMIASLIGAPAAVAAQQTAGSSTPAASQARELLEAGQYQQVVDSAGPDAEPAVVFAAVLSQEKLGNAEEAKALSRRLAERPDDDAWHFVGLSMSELLADQTDPALDAARRAVEIAPMLADAHHQLGLVLAKRQEWKEAAAAFDRVTMTDPEYAYGYYYGGLSHYRANRPDLMAVRFERFLKLAPKAPERPEVMQIMRTIRGR